MNEGGKKERETERETERRRERDRDEKQIKMSKVSSRTTLKALGSFHPGLRFLFLLHKLNSKASASCQHQVFLPKLNFDRYIQIISVFSRVWHFCCLVHGTVVTLKNSCTKIFQLFGGQGFFESIFCLDSCKSSLESFSSDAVTVSATARPPDRLSPTFRLSEKLLRLENSSHLLLLHLLGKRMFVRLWRHRVSVPGVSSKALDSSSVNPFFWKTD